MLSLKSCHPMLPTSFEVFAFRNWLSLFKILIICLNFCIKLCGLGFIVNVDNLKQCSSYMTNFVAYVWMTLQGGILDVIFRYV